MAQIVTKAGAFELECWTDGHPLWVKLKIKGEEVEGAHFTVDDLHDLIHAAKRMIDKAQPTVSPVGGISEPYRYVSNGGPGGPATPPKDDEQHSVRAGEIG